MNVPAPKFLVEKTWEGRVFGGDWRSAAGGSLDVMEPATGNKLTSVGNASAADIRKAAAEAKAAQPGWAATPYEERAAVLRKAARALEDNQEELIPWIARETGGIPAKAGFEIHMVTEILYRSSAMCTEPQGLVLPSNPGRISIARRVPRGVIGIISPFNFPLILSTRAVAPALATGNSVILKPDPRTAMTGGFIIARMFEDAGLPKGVLHVLPGGVEAGEAICTDPDIAMVSFTGSSNVGRRIGELAGKHLKKVQLELGGKNAVIVLEDADLDAAASAIAFGSWFHQGQICMTTGRILAKDKIVKALTEKLVGKANHLPVGDPLGQVALGPVISKAQVARIDAIVQDFDQGRRQARSRRHVRGTVLQADGADRREARHARLRRRNLRPGRGDYFGWQRRRSGETRQPKRIRSFGGRVLRRRRPRGRHRQSAQHRTPSHQRPDRRRRTARAVRRIGRVRQRHAHRRSGQLGRVHPMAVGHHQGEAESLSVLRTLKRDPHTACLKFWRA